MRALTAILVSLLLFTTPFASAQSPAQKKANATPEQPAQRSLPLSDSERTAAVRKDLDRMRSLLQQMQTNLAFVDTRQSALGHQFDLQIQMWQLLIDDLDHLTAAEQRAPDGATTTRGRE